MDWSMGGYGFYVWGSYLCALIAIGLEILSLMKRKRSCEQRAEGSRKTSHSAQASAWGSEAR